MEIWAGWPKGALTAGGRSCGICGAGLDLSSEVIETSPGSRLLIDGPEKAKTKRKRNVGDSFVPSTKLEALVGDLMRFSQQNPQSDNYNPMADEVEELDDKGQPIITKSIVL